MTRTSLSWLLLVSLLGACGGEEAAPLPRAEVTRARIERVVIATGTVEPATEVAVRPRIAGIICIGVLNMMLDSVRERRREIGLRLAVGATRRDILVQFFIETFAIVAIGGLLGVAIGVAGCLGLAALEVPDLLPVPVLTGWVVMLALGVMGASAWRRGSSRPGAPRASIPR